MSIHVLVSWAKIPPLHWLSLLAQNSKDICSKYQRQCVNKTASQCSWKLLLTAKETLKAGCVLFEVPPSTATFLGIHCISKFLNATGTHIDGFLLICIFVT